MTSNKFDGGVTDKQFYVLKLTPIGRSGKVNQYFPHYKNIVLDMNPSNNLKNARSIIKHYDTLRRFYKVRIKQGVKSEDIKKIGRKLKKYELI